MLASMKFIPFGNAATNLCKRINFNVFAGKRECRKFSSNEGNSANFDKMISNRQTEASRSIIIQVASEKSFRDVYQHCAQFGNVSNAFFYTMPKNDNFILLEYDSLESAYETLRLSAYNSNTTDTFPVQSRFLWFRNVAKRNAEQFSEIPIELKKMNASCEPPPTELAHILTNADSMSDQIQLLYENTRLTDLAIRLRFLGALQVQTALSGIFSNCAVYPFGSSINGFGKMGSDLDMILCYNKDCVTAKHNQEEYDARRFVFHAKSSGCESDSSKREIIQNHIRCFGSILDCLLPGLTNVMAIYGARVPIVKYFHTYLNLSVDLSVLNMAGFYVNELFYTFGELDSRVRPLVFIVRRWAQEFKLTKSGPGSSITNFQLTCLVLSFLQQLNEPILPTLNQMIQQARIEDIRNTDENINCTFLRDCSQIEFKTKNTSFLSELFMQFLEYYGAFDFSTRMITLSSTRKFKKIDPSPLYIVNPFELEKNCSRNVSSIECDRIKVHAQQTIGYLLDCDEKPTFNNDRWGLLEIFTHLE